MSNLQLNDPSSVWGMSGLLDTDDIDIDLDKLEAEVSGKVIDNNDDDNYGGIDNFQSELDRLGENKASDIQNRFPANHKLLEDSDDDSIDIYPKKNSKNNKKVNPLQSLLDEVNNEMGDDSDDEPIKYRDPVLNRRTNEQKKANAIHRALADVPEVSNVSFDFDKEDEEDKKAQLLEEIDTLVEILTEEEVDIKRITLPTSESSIPEMIKARDILRLKNDRSRSRMFAEETFLAGAQGLEFLFDGKKTYLGRRPDLTDWSSTVNVKLRRMRYDTSSFVNGIMRTHNFGPGTRIMLELIPSMLIYSRTRKRQYGDDIYTTEQMGDALNDLRDIHDGARDD